ncbi:MAG: BatD family protein, partial [Gammaproteobacteria bacterium]|nr:BatD family protein [Gammaproteobacteria bacterium]
MTSIRRWLSRLRLALTLSLLAAGSIAHAQRVMVQTTPEPHYAGVAIELNVVADGFEETPQPRIEAGEPSRGDLQLVGVAPNISTSIQIVNGQMSQSKTVRYVFRYRFMADQPGVARIPPFVVSQDGKRATSAPVQLELQSVAIDDQQRVRVVLPDKPLWLGQRGKVLLQWWLKPEMAERVIDHQMVVPLFDHTDLFRFEDESQTDSRTRLQISTQQGRLELPADILRQNDANGTLFLVVQAERTLIPIKPGTAEIEPASIVTEEAVRWRRGFMGSREPAQVRRTRAVDEPLSLSVRALPQAGRPAS